MHALISTIRQQRHHAQQQAITAYLVKRQPQTFFYHYGQALDKLLTQLWQHFFAQQPLCLLAIGGYGRNEIYPYSDLDLALVSSQPLTLVQQNTIACFIQTLWDIQLSPAVKVGSITELCDSARHDLTTDTALLEARLLCGETSIGEQLLQALNHQRSPAAFIEGKLIEMQQRHDKQQGSGAVLEPNVKTCAGGLRDIHTMMWLAKIQGIPANINALTRQRLLTRLEAGILINSHKQLARIRIELHLTAKREEDRLVFDLQSQIASQLGFQDDPKRRKSEKLMYTLYRATKAVKQLNGIILPMLHGRVYSSLPRIVHPINNDYYQIGNQIAARDKNLFHNNPTHIFKIIEILQERNDLTTIAPQTLRAWWVASKKINSHFYNNESNRLRFLGFFQHGNRLTYIMRFLNLYGVLGLYLPAWGKIVGLLQHDLFHIYPVDDHILMVLRNIRRLAMDEHLHELPFASSLMHSFNPKKQYILYLAALFHDIAKGRGGDHAIQGITDAYQFATDHFMNTEDNELLCWLVENHLLMSATAQKEDIQNPDIVQRFCHKVQTSERLTALYLLTISDIRGTNPKLWNSWKANLLEHLFKAASAYFAGEHNNRDFIANHRQIHATQVLNQAGYDIKHQRRLWQALGAAYFVRHEENEINWHILNLAPNIEQATVCLRPYHNDHTRQIMVYMPNAPRLFAHLCRIFSHHGLDIIAARAFVTDHNYILDTFIVQLPAHRHSNDFQHIEPSLLNELHDFLNGIAPQDNQTCGIRSRRARHLPIAPSITLTAEDDAGWYTLNIIAINRPYLLANIAEVFNQHHISLRHAKINTLEERVEDSFLLYCPDLADPNKQIEVKQALLEQLAI